MALRGDQVAMTRQRIIDAVVEVSTEDGGAISVAEVARRSGISPATIYRHFPNRDALVSAAATDRVERNARGADTWGLDDEREHLVELWSDLAENMALTRQGVVTEGGRELRKARFERFGQMNVAALAAAGVDPTTPDARRYLACSQVLSSVHALLDLHDRQGLSATDAVDAVSWGIEVLTRAIGLDPAQLRVSLTGIREENEKRGA
jgi:AcrR family transcriptional regulator